MDALIFIDTNIFLDFYRIVQSNIKMDYLNLIDKNHDKIITGNQVEMEFMKNRQKVILESYRSVKAIDWNSLTPPAMLADDDSVTAINQMKSQINSQHEVLREKIMEIFKKPAESDPVYAKLQKLFENDTELNLNRDKLERFEIRNLAKKRFALGYPPRKSTDTSIGDAYNWEWIIACAKKKKKDIIIVSRDEDYGVFVDKKADTGFLNDWLVEEFRSRVERNKKLVLTNKLSWAFKQVKTTASVTDAMTKEEDRIVNLISPALSLNTPKDLLQGQVYGLFAEIAAKLNNSPVNLTNSFSDDLLEKLKNIVSIKNMSDQDSTDRN